MSVQVPKGYQQTEVGVIPEDWEVEKLGDLVDPNRTIRYGIVQPGQYSLNGRYMIRGQDYSRGWVDSIEIFRVSESIEKPFENARVKKGDVLITIVGASTGHIATVPDWLDGANLTQTTARIAPKKNIDGKFLSYILLSPIGKLQVANYIKGAAQPGLNCGDIEKFLIPVPVIHEQQAIAKALSDADALIESLEQLIAKKRQIKQGAMQELLTGQRRLPGFSGGWARKKLGDVASLYQPVTISASQFTESGYPVYGANGVVGYFNDFNHSSWQVTVTCRGSTCGTVNRTVEKCWITGNAMVVNCEESTLIDKNFIYYKLLSSDLKKCITGTGQPQIIRGPLADFEIKIPIDLSEQRSIAEILLALDDEIDLLAQRLDKARQIKQSMMQELLTGRIRLI